GVGDGTFRTAFRLRPTDPQSLALADLLAHKPPLVQPPGAPFAGVLGDFNRDGFMDVAGPISANQIGIALLSPQQKATIDFPRLTDPLGGPVDITQSFRNSYFPADNETVTPSRATPLLADLTGDNVPDVVVVSRGGDILLRPGRPDQAGTFGPPELINADPNLPRARAVAILSTGTNARVAALDLDQDSISIYALTPAGWRRTLAIPVASFTSRIAAADLDG